MMKNKKIERLFGVLVTLLILFVVIVILVLLRQFLVREKHAETVTIAIMQEDRVQDFNTNYYKIWLEEQSGYQIKFVYIQSGYYKEYIRALLEAREGTIDAIFLPANMKIITEEEFETYGKAGYFANILDYIDSDSNLNALFDSYQDVRLKDKMTEPDGEIYYMPNMNTSRQARNFQVLWINFSWLKKLGLTIPKSTEEFHDVLKAFRELDANKNGKQDEIPLISCEEEYALQSYNYLLNAFVPNDPVRGRLFLNSAGTIVDAFHQDAFREGLTYCHTLYGEGLFAKEGFTFSKKQVQELVNDPANLVGAFTSQSIADIVYANSPDVLTRYIQVPPLAGPTGEKHAIMLEPEPCFGGMIPINSSHKKEACAIMDLMLSKEASLIAEFGEEGVDWKFSKQSDLSTYGTKAKITTIHYLKDKVQNQNFMGAGPHVINERYINGVTWNGNSSNVEYIDSRAIMRYEPDYLARYPDSGTVLQENLASKSDKIIPMFIKGELDILDDTAWNVVQEASKKGKQ
ncbi:MAG: extracellular solute-binding protein [Velocimicrobium sp.]